MQLRADIGQGIEMANALRSLRAHYEVKKCVYCGRRLEPRVTDETILNPDSHDGIYKDDPQGWAPHYDVEYSCENGDYYEHYTHSVDGTLQAMRINRVVFVFATNEFSIMEKDKIKPAGKLPEGVEFGSEAFQKHLDRVLKKAYPKTAP